MPCICYGAKSEKEEIDGFLSSVKGKEAMEHLNKASEIIKSHEVDRECDLTQIEFRQTFVKCFLHMMVGCDEHGRPKAK